MSNAEFADDPLSRCAHQRARWKTLASSPRFFALVASAAMAMGCAPAPLAPSTVAVAPSRPSGSAQTPAADVAPADATAPGTVERTYSSSRCPLSFDGADIELARVAGQSITACDVALLSLAALREGGSPLAPRDALSRAVRDATFAREATARGLDRDAETQERLQRTLADALARDATRRSWVAPERSTIQRYFEEHRAEFDRVARVHVRAVVTSSEPAARAALRELSAGRDFGELARARSVAAGAERDDGDLGLVTEEGNELVPRAVAQRAFALTEFASVAPDPVRVEVTERVGRRRRPRTRVRFYVVQRLERIDAEPATLEAVARRIAFRLSLTSFRAALVRARGELLAGAQSVDAVSIDSRALTTVSLRPVPAPARSSGASRRVAAPRRR